MRRKKAQSLTGVSKTYRFKHSEHSEQVGFVNWFRAKYPHTLIFAIPNGEKRSISVATRLKAEGVTRGIPDLYIPACNLWVEMKRATGGRLSPELVRKTVEEIVELSEDRKSWLVFSIGIFDKTQCLPEGCVGDTVAP